MIGRSCRIVRLILLALMASAVGQAAPAAIPAGFAVNTVWQLDEPMRIGDYAWDDEGAPSGRIRIVVDLSAEMLYVYRAGVEIGRSSILYGYDRKPTPTGIFPIMEKRIDHYSRTYRGAPMPYMMRLTRGGVAIHGSLVADGYATHGCVGLPEDFAALLFAQARVGDKVLITRGWMVDEYRGQSVYP